MTAAARRFCAMLLAASLPAWAQDWQMADGSTLGFRTSFQGEAFDGRFTRFTPQVRFNPEDLANARFDVRIDLASADTRNSERDDTLKSADFFDVGKTPTARYTATAFTALGNGRYRADGRLQLRGNSRPVALVFSWKQNKGAVLAGEAVLNRLDFGVGAGDWADTGLLPDAVQVKTLLILTPKAPAKP